MKLAIEQNNVSAENQVSETNSVKLYNVPDALLKIAIVGNSITLHNKKEDIGWYGEWGMAASCAEKDYCHLIMRDFRAEYPKTSFIIVQAADWERSFWSEPCDYPKQLHMLEQYDPDIIILRLSENSGKELCEQHDFAEGFMKLCAHFSDKGRRKLLITDSFWYSPWTAPGIEAAAKKYCDSGKAVNLSDLGNMDEMKALGLFEHPGVAAHPGDIGMRAIADRILERLYKLV